MSNQSKPLGLILVGGQSLRMKQAKAHLVLKDKPQWQASEDVLRPFCDEVYFSTSKKLNPPLKVAKDRQIPDLFLEPIGPLGGIISAFKIYREAFLVLACDMPFFTEEAAGYLLTQRNSAKKATLFVTESGVEPLCGIYEPGIFNDLLNAFSKDIYCMRKIVQELDIERVKPLKDEWLLNLNHAHELQGLKVATEVTVHYYASLREAASKSEEVLKTKAQNIGELFRELKSRYGFLVSEEDLRFAKNNQLVSAMAAIEDQDEVVFIPPVSGG